MSEEVEGVVEALKQLDGDGVMDYVFSSPETSINLFLIDLKAVNSDLRDKMAKKNLLRDEVFKLDQKQLNQWYLKMFARMDKVCPKIIKSDTKPVSDLSPLTDVLRDSLLRIESGLGTSRQKDLTPKLKRPHFDGGDLLAYNKFFRV